jgi:hypothetical protein
MTRNSQLSRSIRGSVALITGAAIPVDGGLTIRNA